MPGNGLLMIYEMGSTLMQPSKPSKHLNIELTCNIPFVQIMSSTELNYDEYIQFHKKFTKLWCNKEDSMAIKSDNEQEMWYPHLLSIIWRILPFVSRCLICLSKTAIMLRHHFISKKACPR